MQFFCIVSSLQSMSFYNVCLGCANHETTGTGNGHCNTDDVQITNSNKDRTILSQLEAVGTSQISFARNNLQNFFLGSVVIHFSSRKQYFE